MSKRALQDFAKQVTDSLVRRGALSAESKPTPVRAANTNGFLCVLASTSHGSIDLWLDTYRSLQKPELYYGFASVRTAHIKTAMDFFCEPEDVLRITSNDQSENNAGRVELKPAKSAEAEGRFMCYLGKDSGWFGRYSQAEEDSQAVDEAILFFQSILQDVDFSGREGKLKTSIVKRYERNPALRAEAIRIQGCKCSICYVDFAEVYGSEIGGGFIHVHHRTPISTGKGEEKSVSPEKDLLTVCPNCHAMLHRRDPPIDPDVLRDTIKRRRKDRECATPS